MDFEGVFKLLFNNFKEHKIDFAIIGGIALQVGGFTRATKDLDMLVAKEDFAAIKKIMLSSGYELLHESENVANFLSKMPALGQVDFLLAHRKYTKAMLLRARKVKVLKDEFEVKVVIPEDLIGLKVQSSSNDPNRYFQDMADIEHLLMKNHKNMDMDLVREYFKIFKREEELLKLLKEIKNAE